MHKVKLKIIEEIWLCLALPTRLHFIANNCTEKKSKQTPLLKSVKELTINMDQVYVACSVRGKVNAP